MYNKRLAVSIVSLVACLMGATVYGDTSETSEHYADANATPHPSAFQDFKLQPRLNFWGYSGDNTLGETQLLMPIYGDTTRVLYGLLEGNVTTNNDSWLAGGGLGYRQVVDDARIFGGYALLDYNNSAHNNGFWVINPGLEMLGQVWDASISGYFPLRATKKVGAEQWAYDMLDVKGFNARDYFRFTGHDEYAHRLQIAEEAGRGVSVEVGRVIPHFTKAKIYLGGYYFDTKDFGSTNGVEARLTYDINKYAGLEVKDIYDRVNHNQVLLGLRLTLGGYSDEQKQNFGISSRLTDPLEHNFARFNGSSEVFIKRQYLDKGEYKIHDNLWFFEPVPTTAVVKQEKAGADDAAVGDGTYENPFVGLTPANYAVINPHIGVIDLHPWLYFAPGQYSFLNFTSQVGPGRFDLPNGWGMYGRTADYKEAAQGDDRALFAGGLDMNYASEAAGQATNNIVSIRVHNNMTYTAEEHNHSQGAAMQRTNGVDLPNAAIYVRNASNVTMQDVDISGVANSNLPTSIYAYGIYADHANVNFNSGTNTIFSSGSTTGVSEIDCVGYGIFADNGSTVTFNGGNNTVSGVGLNTFVIVGYGIFADNGSDVVFNGGTNTISGTGSVATTVSSSGVGAGIGIMADNGSKITFNGGTNTISGVSEIEVLGAGSGIEAYNGSTVTFNGGTNTVFGQAAGDAAYGYGIYAGSGDHGKSLEAEDAGAYIIFNGGTNNISGSGEGGSDDGKGYGIYVEDGSSLVFANPTAQKVNISANGTTDQYGIYAESDSHINHLDLDIGQYVAFQTLNPSTGYAVYWDSHWNLPW